MQMKERFIFVNYVSVFNFETRANNAPPSLDQYHLLSDSYW